MTQKARQFATTLYWKRLWRTGKGDASKALRRQWLTGILLQRGLWTVAQLADTLGVSKATCQRDLDLLGDLFYVRMEHDPRHSQRARYRMIGSFKPTLGAFPLRKLRGTSRKRDRKTS